MLEFRRRHPVLDAIWVLLTGPLVVFAVTDWFLKFLPTSATVVVSLLGLAAAIGIAYRWQRLDGWSRRRGPRGYRGRHTAGQGGGDAHREPTDAKV